LYLCQKIAFLLSTFSKSAEIFSKILPQWEHKEFFILKKILTNKMECGTSEMKWKNNRKQDWLNPIWADFVLPKMSIGDIVKRNCFDGSPRPAVSDFVCTLSDIYQNWGDRQ
jgi:hypothetical protein